MKSYQRLLTVIGVLVSVFFAQPVATIGSESAKSGQSCYPVNDATPHQSRLNAFWGLNVRVCGDNSLNGAMAYRQSATVIIDPQWMLNMGQQFGSWAPVGILAHEWGHVVQNTPSGTAAELQADCLAGVFMRGAGLSVNAVQQFASANFLAGDGHWSPTGHGTGQQRVTAALRGFQGFQPNMNQYQLLTLCPASAF